VYHGEELELYPTIIYFSHPLELYFRDLALFQLILCCEYSNDELKDLFDHMEDDQQSLMNMVINNFGVD
jgi:hypothetical protein